MSYRLSAQFPIDRSGKAVPATIVPDIALAARYYRAGDHAAVDRVCDAILAREPRHFDALHLRGVSCLHQQQPKPALAFLRRALRERPDNPRVHFHIGNALLALRRYRYGERALRRSLALQPGDFDALNNLGSALTSQSRFDEAVRCLRQAIAVRPQSPQPLYNLGRALAGAGRLEEADDTLRATLALAGDAVEPRRLVDMHTALADVLARQGRVDQVVALYRAAPQPVAADAVSQWNLSLALLMLGDYADGWRLYEGRFQVRGHDAPRDGAALLDLATVAGRRVLLFPEQGRGDMLQFARYLPLLAARGATVLVEIYPELKQLLQAIDGVSQVVAPDEPTPDHDLLTPLLSLPAAFGTVLETIPATVPYLRVPPARLAQWAALLGPRRCPRIGIAWRGSAESAPRSAMPVAQLASLLASPGVAFHCLQKELSAEDQAWLAQHPEIACHGHNLADFADTAALIAQLDLVISVDTAVAHLAGALGQPVWIMLPFAADWRWLRHRDDSPWYPTARLFRQPQRGDWDDVVRRVAAALSVERFQHQVEGDQHRIVAAQQ